MDLAFNTRAVGKSGTSIASGEYQEEYLEVLRGDEAAEIYDRMKRSDPQIRKILSAIKSPIKSATWSIEQISDEPKDLEAAALLNQIFFKDIDWNHKLGEILTFIEQGYSIFEVIHLNRNSKEFGNYTGLDTIAFRSQKSITEWDHDRATGRLKRVHQERSGDIEVDVWLPVDILLLFFNEQEGDDNGFPLLRPLYGPWKRKQLIETLKMIGIERSAIGVPMLKVPSNIKPSDKEYEEAVRLLAAFTSAENSYITYPEGWELELNNNNVFDPTKLESSIKSEDEKMAGAIIATFLELGTGGNSGAFALSENLERFFSLVIESFAKNITGVINNVLIPNLIKLNFGDTIEIMPELKFSGISDRAGKEFMEIVVGFVGSGVVTKDEPLEDFIRKKYKLPKKVEGDMVDNQESKNDLPVDAPVEEETSLDQEVADAPEVQLSESISLADKTPRGLITNDASVVEEVMRDNLTKIAEKLTADIVSRYKKLPENDKLKAIDGIKIGGKAQYKRLLKGNLTTTSTRALSQATLEAPVQGKVKLAENAKMTEALLDGWDGKFKFNEFSNLPKHVQLLITRQAENIVDRQTSDLESRVAFQFMGVSQTTQDPDVIKSELENAATEFVESAQIATAATNVVSTLVNQTRNEYFFAPEVEEQIYAYKFNNLDPKSAICKKLAGVVFAKNDTEFLLYSPPLHHNCKSFLSVVLQSARTKPEIKPLPPLTSEDRKSVTLSEKENVDILINIFENSYTKDCKHEFSETHTIR